MGAAAAAAGAMGAIIHAPGPPPAGTAPAQRAIRLHTLVQHLQPEYNTFRDNTEECIELIGGVLKVRHKDSSKIKFLSGELFSMAAKMARLTVYAHCAEQHEAFVDNLICLWNRVSPQALQTYYYAVADKVAAQPHLHTFASNHAFEYEIHVRIPSQQQQVGSSSGGYQPQPQQQQQLHYPGAQPHQRQRVAPPAPPRLQQPPYQQQVQQPPPPMTRAQRLAVFVRTGVPSSPSDICDQFAVGHCPKPGCMFMHYCVQCGTAQHGQQRCPAGHISTAQLQADRLAIGHPAVAPRQQLQGGGGRGGGRGGRTRGRYSGT